MTPQQVLATALRLAALLLLVWSVKYLVEIPLAARQFKTDASMGLAYAVGATYLVLAAVLWFFPLLVAHKLIPRTHFDNHLNLQPLEAARVGSALIGLWFFLEGLRGISFYFVSFFVYTDQPLQYMPTDLKLDLLAQVVQFTVSLLLVFRSADVARLIVRPAATKAGE